ncbi:MAG: nucleotidyltransferase domain-containing protein [Persephonella sp.]|nr:MAG: nucleotidyltransferase domain-containing protein [Persephonella sp.]RUM60518.1 MAG: nucleotidyltransferase domain-containing protein [Persephonella sp.]
MNNIKNINKYLKSAKHIRTINDLKRFLKDYFKGTDVKIYLFGSRARGDNSIYSDIDLAVKSDEDIKEKISLLTEILEESYLPYKVDIVDLKNNSYLEEIVKKEGIRWI